MAHIGKNVARALKQRGIAQAEMGRQLSCSKQYIHQLLKTRVWNSNTIEEVMGILNVPVELLFQDHEDVVEMMDGVQESGRTGQKPKFSVGKCP